MTHISLFYSGICRIPVRIDKPELEQILDAALKPSFPLGEELVVWLIAYSEKRATIE